MVVIKRWVRLMLVTRQRLARRPRRASSHTAIRVARKLKAIDVIDVLSGLFILRGVPAHIRSDNGPEFVAHTASLLMCGEAEELKKARPRSRAEILTAG
jgi:hypothetical protein